MALYTLVALAASPQTTPSHTHQDGSKEVTRVEIAGIPLELHCVKWGRGKDVLIRTCYPKAV